LVGWPGGSNHRIFAGFSTQWFAQVLGHSGGKGLAIYAVSNILTEQYGNGLLALCEIQPSKDSTYQAGFLEGSFIHWRADDWLAVVLLRDMEPGDYCMKWLNSRFFVTLQSTQSLAI